jgi:hypothetical protein
MTHHNPVHKTMNMAKEPSTPIPTIRRSCGSGNCATAFKKHPTTLISTQSGFPENFVNEIYHKAARSEIPGGAQRN